MSFPKSEGNSLVWDRMILPVDVCQVCRKHKIVFYNEDICCEGCSRVEADCLCVELKGLE